MNEIQRLQSWFSRQCNDEWEHFYGPKIESCDNPGWLVTVTLTGTKLEDVSFSRIADNTDDAGFQLGDRWLDCSKTQAVWKGAGDETQLERILCVFLDWAESHGS